MYTREENIPEENLDWDKSLENKEHLEVQSEPKESKKIIHPTIEHNKIVLEKKVKLNDLNVKKSILNLINEHSEMSFFLGLLTLPYIIGFIIVSFILFYGGVPIDRFFSLKEGIFHFELWSIGAYIFITVGVIWLVILLFVNKK
jgi:hypothetical protein